MTKKVKKIEVKQNVFIASRSVLRTVTSFLKTNKTGLIVMAVATLVFFAPLLPRLATYSEGGDAMFNAWTLSRNHHCILQQGCPKYSDANIYYPHPDTMLYSETQLSAGALTLPLYAINKNPIFSYNVWTILSFFYAGFFMYLLSKQIGRRDGVIPITAGLIFEFAPLKLSAVSHLQNLSIFYLPLIVLLILKYYEKRDNKYLAGLFVALVLQFYASWYQMVFVLISLIVLLGSYAVLRLKTLRQLLPVGGVIIAALICTVPLAKEYTRFSKANKATFGIKEQVTYSSSLSDYIAPSGNTALGRIAHKINPSPKIRSYNIDSASFSGFTLYLTSMLVIAFAYKKRRSSEGKTTFREILGYACIGVVGFIVSLGPLLKIYDSAKYADLANGLSLVVPMPYYFVDKFLPQLSFIRAIGRASVLFLFALCCLLAYVPRLSRAYSLNKRHAAILHGAITVLVLLELMPLTLFHMQTEAYHYNLKIPDVYRYVATHKEVNNIVILAADKDYPGATIPVARAEQVLWSGYHNKNIFNGYSGYTPPDYFRDYDDYVDFHSDDVTKMKFNKLDYVIVDRQLSTSNPKLDEEVSAEAKEKVYQDERYSIYRI